MVIFHCYVSSPEGTPQNETEKNAISPWPCLELFGPQVKRDDSIIARFSPVKKVPIEMAIEMEVHPSIYIYRTKP